jgi:hypothetical protein
VSYFRELDSCFHSFSYIIPILLVSVLETITLFLSASFNIFLVHTYSFHFSKSSAGLNTIFFSTISNITIMAILKTLVLALAIGFVSAAPNGSRKHRTTTTLTKHSTSIVTKTATSIKVSPSAVHPTTTALAASSAISTPSTVAHSGIWQPAVGTKWQIELSQVIKVDSTLDPSVGIYDTDLFDTPKSSIDQLHSLGKKVICYFSAGSYEPGRPDSAQFTASDKGSELDGWPGEYWLNINSANVRSIMAARLQLAATKGCDGVDPDNVDGYVSSLVILSFRVLS